MIKKINAEYHLKHKCPKCKKKKTRDILGSGNCFWEEKWKKKEYDIPMWMGIRNFLRMKILRKPMKIKYKGKKYMAKEV